MQVHADPWKFLNEVAALARQSGVDPPTDPDQLALFRLLRSQETDNVLVETAYFIYRSDYRHAMDALIICSAKAEDVENALELAPGVYAVYQKLFFDRTVFRSVFEMRQYIGKLNISEDDRSNYDLALLEGPRRLLNRYRLTSPPVPDSQEVLEEMMTEAVDRAFEHRGKSITSKTAQESFKWGRAAVQTAVALKQAVSTSRAANALEQLEFALKSTDQSKTPEDLGVTADEILT